MVCCILSYYCQQVRYSLSKRSTIWGTALSARCLSYFWHSQQDRLQGVFLRGIAGMQSSIGTRTLDERFNYLQQHLFLFHLTPRGDSLLSFDGCCYRVQHTLASKLNTPYKRSVFFVKNSFYIKELIFCYILKKCNIYLIQK